ncbi:MAG: hypothetical protein KAI66_26320 [Lentisphaeria bacterium]|nr:hypothetical protein [Lentisphaeria bacterium]
MSGANSTGGLGGQPAPKASRMCDKRGYWGSDVCWEGVRDGWWPVNIRARGDVVEAAVRRGER